MTGLNTGDPRQLRRYFKYDWVVPYRYRRSAHEGDGEHNTPTLLDGDSLTRTITMNMHRIRCNVVVAVLLVVMSRGASGWTLTPNRRDALRLVVAAGIVATTNTVVDNDRAAWAFGEGEPRM
eukprot:scaffold2590_cov160-Amphora_coffeaeformis.AAC.2